VHVVGLICGFCLGDVWLGERSSKRVVELLEEGVIERGWGWESALAGSLECSSMFSFIVFSFWVLLIVLGKGFELDTACAQLGDGCVVVVDCCLRISLASLILHLRVVLIFISSFCCWYLGHEGDEEAWSLEQFAHWVRVQGLGVWGGKLHISHVGVFCRNWLYDL